MPSIRLRDEKNLGLSLVLNEKLNRNLVVNVLKKYLLAH